MTPSTLPPAPPQQPSAGHRPEGQFVQYADYIEQQIADTRGRVKWVELFSESLGPDGGETYVEMVRTNAQRIADALA